MTIAAQVRTEQAAAYAVNLSMPTGKRAEDEIIAQALEILRNRLAQPGAALESPEAVRQYLQLAIAAERSEVFGMVLLDTRHRVLAIETIFQGGIDGASVYLREVVKLALAHNAAACILYHNHPSGVTEPSQADRALTDKLKEALTPVEVRVLDHFIVGGCQAMQMTSMREEGLF